MTPPPIPVMCAARPTQAGLVVPWVSVTLADGTFDLGNMHTAKANRCYLDGLCQVCRQRITPPYVFLVDGPDAPIHAGEPPLHAVCAAYSVAACPMLSGRMRTYRATPGRTHGPAGQVCPEPGCDCGGWVPAVENDRAGVAAPAWFQVWAGRYDVTVPDEASADALRAGLPPAGKVGARITAPLRVRPVGVLR